MEGLEVICAYPEYGCEVRELRKKQTAGSDECECVEKITGTLGMLLALEQEKQGYQESDRR